MAGTNTVEQPLQRRLLGPPAEQSRPIARMRRLGYPAVCRGGCQHETLHL